MSKRLCFLGSLAAASIAPVTSLAYDGEYVTYGGFEAVENAFRYVALFFNHSEYGGLVFTIAVIGFALGAVNAFFRSGRDASQLLGHLIMLLFGAAFFLAFVVPKGNVNVYDPTKNATASVGGVPDGIVLMAKLASDIQGVGVSIANAASPRLYEDTANGSIFDIVRASVGAGDAIANQLLLESTKDYFVKCVRPATSRVSSGLTLDELKKTSTDLMTSFAKAADDAHFSIVYTAADPAGTAYSCRDAWGILQPQLAAAATYAAYEDAICTRSDFDVADPAQKARCQVIMDEIPAELFKQAGPSDRYTYLRASALAYAMEEALRDINPERAIAADTNRRFMEQGSGFFVIANEYGPFMRAAFLAAALGTLPMLFLFLPTPYFTTVLRLFLGFFAFVTLWSIIDVGMAQIAHGIAVDAFADVTSGALAYGDLLLRPPASAKALAVFGTTRFIAISFSALFVVTIFKISGASFAAMTGGMERTATAAGDGAANAVLNPAGRINSASANASAAGRGAVLSRDDDSFGDFRDMQAGDLAAGIGRVRGVDQQLGRGAYVRAMAAEGARSGGESAGGVSASAAAAGLSSQDGLDGTDKSLAALAGTGADRGAMEAAGRFGAAQAKWEVAKSLAARSGGDPMSEALKLGHMGGFGEVARAAAAESVAAAEKSLRIGAERDVGTNLGFDEGARLVGSTPEGVSRASGALDAAYQSGDQTYLGGASRDDIGMIAGAGETRRFRQEGGRRGLESAADYLGMSPGDTASRAEGTFSARSLISAATARRIGNQVFGDENRLFEGQAGTTEFAASPEVLQSLHEEGHFGDAQYRLLRDRGAVVSLARDERGEIVSVSARALDSATSDATVSASSGLRLNQGNEVSGGTLYAAAFEGSAGISKIANAAAAPKNIRDQYIKDAANEFEKIVSSERVLNEFANNSGVFSAFASGQQNMSWSTPGVVRFVSGAEGGFSATIGARGEISRGAGENLSRSDGASVHTAFVANELEKLSNYKLGEEWATGPEMTPAEREELWNQHYEEFQTNMQAYRSDLINMRSDLVKRGEDPEWIDDMRNPQELTQRLERNEKTETDEGIGQTAGQLGNRGSIR